LEDPTNGDIVVTDYNNNRVELFDAGGTFLGTFGTFGSGPGEFINPTGVAVDAQGRLIVSDQFDDRIQVFAPAEPVPEPSSLALLAVGAAILAAWGRFRGGRRQKSGPPQPAEGSCLSGWGWVGVSSAW
jgi:hypothetical protein